MESGFDGFRRRQVRRCHHRCACHKLPVRIIRRMNLLSKAHRATCGICAPRGLPRTKPCGSAARLMLITALCVGAVRSIAADPANSPVPGQHPITGQWTWKLPDKACTETLQFRADGIRVGTSGEESTEGPYQITTKPSLLGFYRLTETLTVANGKRDCSGDLQAASGETVTRYIQFSPTNDLLIVCMTESLRACYGPLRRVPG